MMSPEKQKLLDKANQNVQNLVIENNIFLPEISKYQTDLLRAVIKNFNANFTTGFEETIGGILIQFALTDENNRTH